MKIGFAIQGANALKKAARQIERYPAQAARAGMLAVNDVASTVQTAASRDIAARYNLPASYVLEKFSVREASSSLGVAIVAARKRGTPLARFDAGQLTAAAPRAKGDTRRGIAKGRKQAGVSVKIMRQGQRETFRHAFFMPLRTGKVDGGNGLGMFERAGKRIYHLYGISPHQAFAGWIDDHRPNIHASLAKAFNARLQSELAKTR